MQKVWQILSHLAVVPFFGRKKEKTIPQFLSVERSNPWQNRGNLHEMQNGRSCHKMGKPII